MRRKFIHPVLPAAAFAICLFGSCSLRDPYPSDGRLEANFRARESGFDRLASMLREDDWIAAVDDQEARAVRGPRRLPAERHDEYRRLFNELGVKSAARWREGGDINLLVWREGGALLGGTSVYYVKSESRPQPLVDSLDKIYDGGQDALVFKRIAPGWYVLLDRW